MLGLGLGLNKELVRNTAFNPLTDINGLHTYLNRKNATASSWLDQSINAYDFVQAVGTKQPTIGVNSVNYDNIDDIQVKTVANPFSGDSSGIVFFSGYNTGNTQRYIASSDNAGAADWIGFLIFSNKIGVFTIIGGVSNFLQTTNTVPLGYFYAYIKSTGSSYEMGFNGSIEAFGGGTDNGDWFADVPNRDALEIGGVLRNAPLYSDANIAGIIYTNDHTVDVAPINNFMSNPNNFKL